MRIHRFDAEVGTRIERFGSDLTVSPLVAPGATVAAACLHLPPGGRVGRHPAVSDQLLCVVAGEGWVAGDDGEAHPIGPGQAAWWRAGEEHESGSDGGLTAVVLEGAFDMLAVTRVGDPIVVAEHDPAWAGWFREIEAVLAPAVGDLGTIEHVGSTAVPGLAAKPIIDVDVVVPSDGDVPAAVERLRAVGFVPRGDLGVPGRQAFRPLDGLPPHHLYVVVAGSKAHLDHVRLRDHLRSHPEDALRYAELKRANALAAGRDMDAYVDAKHDLVTELLAKAGR